jgi:hypothetical protein
MYPGGLRFFSIDGGRARPAALARSSTNVRTARSALSVANVTAEAPTETVATLGVRRGRKLPVVATEFLKILQDGTGHSGPAPE